MLEYKLLKQIIGYILFQRWFFYLENYWSNPTCNAIFVNYNDFVRTNVQVLITNVLKMFR